MMIVWCVISAVQVRVVPDRLAHSEGLPTGPAGAAGGGGAPQPTVFVFGRELSVSQRGSDASGAWSLVTGAPNDMQLQCGPGGYSLMGGDVQPYPEGW